MDFRDELAAEVIGELSRQGAELGRYLPDQFAVEVCKPLTGLMLLDNLYAAVRADPSARGELVAKAVTRFLVPDVPVVAWDEARDRLRPLLRHATIGQDPVVAPVPLLRRPALPFLVELVVVDHPDTMQYVTADIATGSFGVREEQVFEAARQALKARALALSAPNQAGVLHLSDDSGDAYLISHLLVDGWLAGLAGAVGGRPVAFVPDTTTLLVGADDRDTLEQMFTTAADIYTGRPKSLSPMGYTVDGAGRVVPYEAPAGDPLRRLVKRADVLLARDVYAEQKRILDRDEDTMEIVSAYTAMQKPDGEIFTYAPWPCGDTTLLPAVDLVIVVDSDGTTSAVPLAQLLAEGQVEEAVEYHPVRYRTLTS